jgi:signal transduction histidine kinase
MNMVRTFFKAALAAVLIALCNGALAQGASGTAAEAKALLEKAVAAVKADKAKALELFDKADGGFKDRDLYPFCFNISDGITVAGPERVRGKDVRTLKDSTGKAFGEDLYKAAQDGKITSVAYMFPKPGTTDPVAKESFVTKAGDLGCGVGYYK